MEDVHIDQDVLQDLKEIMEDEFESLILTFLKDAVLRLKSIKEALNKQNPDDLRHSAHAFKGSSGNIGAPALSDLCKKLENLGKSGITEGGEPLYQALENEFACVKTCLENLIS